MVLDLLLENNHDTYAHPKMINVINCNAKPRCRKMKHVLRQIAPNRYRFSEK